MYRQLYQDLIHWKNKNNRKPLILHGARQVGKTYILKEFGNTEFKNLLYLNCENNAQLSAIFFDFDIPRIIRSLEIISNQKIIPNETLIFFDEIQEIPKALTSLKYFYENCPEYYVVVAGSLLGVSIHSDSSFPVGKTNSLHLYPMNFEEFLLAMGESSKYELLKTNNWNTIDSFRISFIDLLRQYYFIGGMPEAVLSYVTYKNPKEVREIQNELLKNYILDISKHAPNNDIPKINKIWNSIPPQLAKENKKFIYNSLQKGARGSQFENAIQWLVDAGLVYKIHKITKADLPLKYYEDENSFKLYLLDCGLMGAQANTPIEEILIGNSIFVEYKGAFTEVYVLQQLKTNSERFIHYFSNEKSSLEIDFIVQYKNQIIPIEVKSEVNLKSKSLKFFLEKFPTLNAIRCSMAPYKKEEKITNIPLYGINQLV
ncbi:MAG TPA: ATP-binding protein [Bacteroidales bacterium]|jgi:predicted AAA+ superfamily ATPase|nr:ATP-binding protein [Bacteroidales bacterium]HPS72297.1 ATP-binding protein [Bacteroidales bacterium]